MEDNQQEKFYSLQPQDGEESQRSDLGKLTVLNVFEVFARSRHQVLYSVQGFTGVSAESPSKEPRSSLSEVACLHQKPSRRFSRGSSPKMAACSLRRPRL